MIGTDQHTAERQARLARAQLHMGILPDTQPQWAEHVASTGWCHICWRDRPLTSLEWRDCVEYDGARLLVCVEGCDPDLCGHCEEPIDRADLDTRWVDDHAYCGDRCADAARRLR